MNADRLPYPSEQELLEFFWCKPTLVDYVRFYTVVDSRGIELRFSFDPIDASIQTTLSLGGAVLEIVSQEMLASLRVRDDTLIAVCRYAGGTVTLELVVRPIISVRWFGLLTG